MSGPVTRPVCADPMCKVFDETVGDYIWKRRSQVVPPVVIPPKPIPTWSETKGRLLEILRWLLAPEMQETSTDHFYLIRLEDLRVSFHGDLAGCAGPYIADLLRPIIGDEWQGLAPAMLLATRFDGSTQSDFDRWFADLLIVTIHEACHWLCDFPDWATRHPRLTSDSLNTFVQQDPNPAVSLAPHGLAEWDGHNHRFIRLMAHACVRVHQRTQICLPITNWLCWNSFGYRQNGWPYLWALHDEITELKALPLSKLKTIDPPAEFMRIWLEDTKVDPLDPVEMAGFRRRKSASLELDSRKGSHMTAAAEMELGNETAAEQRARLLRMEAEAAFERKQSEQAMFLDYADGKAIDFHEMQRLGLTVHQLDSAKSKILANREKRKAIDAVSTADTAIVRLRDEIAEIVRQREASVAEFDNQIRALEADLESHRRAVSHGNDCRREMVRDCTNAEARSVVSQIDQRLESTRRELVDTSSVLTAKRDAMNSCRGRTEPEIGQRFERLSGEVILLQQRRETLEKQIADLNAERSAAELEWLCNPNLF